MSRTKSPPPKARAEGKSTFKTGTGRHKPAAAAGAPKADAATNPPGEVWEAYQGPHMTLVGYVVSERRNPERIICVAPMTIDPDTSPGLAEKERLAGLRACKRVAADLDFAGRSRDVVDYRRRGRLDSTEPMPQDVYGYDLAPLGGGWGRARVEVFPFCPIRFRRWLAFHNANAFGKEERAKYPFDTAGVRSLDGEAKYVTIPAVDIDESPRSLLEI